LLLKKPMEPLKAVLVTEDDESLLNVLKEKLSDIGLMVYTAKNGQEGLFIAKAKMPNIILLDILMPKLDGLKMLEELRKLNDWGKSVPVIILSNLDADDEILSHVVKDQPSYYFIKSDVSLEDIVGKIKELLKL